MPHPAANQLPQSCIDDADPITVANVLDAVVKEMDAARYNNYDSHIEDRLDRLELAVITLAQTVKPLT